MRDDDQRAPGVSPEAAVARHDRRGWRLQSANRGPSVKSAHSYCTPDHLLNPRVDVAADEQTKKEQGT